MEVTYSCLKQKDVINLVDGKHLGRVCDLTFTFPESNITGFTVTGCKGFRFSRQEIFLPINTIVKIGEDAVLVRFGKEEPPKPPRPPKPPKEPDFCPPPCPPDNCPPPCPPNNCPPNRPQFPPDNCPPNRPQFPQGGRRSYDEYE